jgi:hypothetical protein
MMSQPLVATASRPGLFSHLGRPSFVSIARNIYTLNGFRGFFRGLGPTFLRAFPVNASAFFVFEAILRVLGAEKVRCLLLKGLSLEILLESDPDVSFSRSDSTLTDYTDVNDLVDLLLGAAGHFRPILMARCHLLDTLWR